jgi:hypothetical protein
MSKRLQVVLHDKELAEIRQAARLQRMITAEWVRRALRAPKPTGMESGASHREAALTRGRVTK